MNEAQKVNYMNSYHRHTGVYGVCIQDNNLLVVNKIRGPYRNRYDLPGGSIEANESLEEAVKRELLEETGYDVKVGRNLGFQEYIIRYAIEGKSHIQHIALFMEIELTARNLNVFESDDTAGSIWRDIRLFNSTNASPLVLSAVSYNQNGKFASNQVYEDWVTIQ